MDVKSLKKEIFDFLIEKGVESKKLDILGNSPKSNVYTKKVSINKDFNGVEIVGLSLTSSTETFNHANISDMRINTKNRRKEFCNIFVNEAPYDLLAFICEAIKEEKT